MFQILGRRHIVLLTVLRLGGTRLYPLLKDWPEAIPRTPGGAVGRWTAQGIPRATAPALNHRVLSGIQGNNVTTSTCTSAGAAKESEARAEKNTGGSREPWAGGRDVGF